MDHRWAESVARQTKVASVRQGLLHCPASLALVVNRQPNQHLVSMAIDLTSVVETDQTSAVATGLISEEAIVRTSAEVTARISEVLV